MFWIIYYKIKKRITENLYYLWKINEVVMFTFSNRSVRSITM